MAKSIQSPSSNLAVSMTSVASNVLKRHPSQEKVRIFQTTVLEAPWASIFFTGFFFYSSGYGYAVVAAITISFAIGTYTYFLIQGSTENFFVAGRSLPFVVVAMTLAAQSIDSNALLGNVDLSYKFSFWDGEFFKDLFIQKVICRVRLTVHF
jgi:hypothetical protein